MVANVLKNGLKFLEYCQLIQKYQSKDKNLVDVSVSQPKETKVAPCEVKGKEKNQQPASFGLEDLKAKTRYADALKV